MHIRVYTDGGSRGNPGPAASGAVLKAWSGGKEGKVLARVGEYLGVATNNQAEYRAIVIGLLRAKKLGATMVDLRMDSELAQRQLTGVYRVKNAQLAKQVLEVRNLQTQFTKVTFTHVRREQNTEADAVVNEVLDAQVSGAVKS